ncbi:MAG: 23S rRNA (pseudouridine(1915)-N(3))-methyltransferase RlmH [Desulfovibrio sp.]|nr:MAG: 23S rRNA (pseudouridine(1915)-N(3))-methyltransferase RlmH [Desulfovibrio sp.]
MKRIKCLWVGKLKAKHWLDAEAHYLKLLSRHVRLETAMVRDASGRLSPAERNQAEGKSLLAKLGPKDLGVALDERGKSYDSPGLAKLLDTLLHDPVRTPCFIIGGAYGLSDEIKAACPQSLSLGPMTLTHEIARVLLLEQLYRAFAILKGLPYHHG